MSLNTLATIVLSTVFTPAIDIDEATILNSNLLPVNAKGEVLFLSVASKKRFGRLCTPISSFLPCLLEVASPVSIICSTRSSSWSPRKMDIMAGGASSAPSLCSFPGFEAESLKSTAFSSTALIMAASTSINCTFSCGVLPGSNMFFPVSVTIDQLLCFPEPFTPAKGFS